MYLNTDRSIGEYSDASLDKISGKASKAATASAEPHVAPVLNGAHFLLISLTWRDNVNFTLFRVEPKSFLFSWLKQDFKVEVAQSFQTLNSEIVKN
jgi:hypothetical protein